MDLLEKLDSPEKKSCASLEIPPPASSEEKRIKDESDELITCQSRDELNQHLLH